MIRTGRWHRNIIASRHATTLQINNLLVWGLKPQHMPRESVGGKGLKVIGACFMCLFMSWPHITTTTHFINKMVKGGGGGLRNADSEYISHMLFSS